MPPVRPSGLQIAEKCSRAPWLSHKYPEENAAIRNGNEVDADISRVLLEGGQASTKEGAALAAWVRKRFSPTAQFFIQHKVRLLDPETGDVITEGTPDLLVLDGKRLYDVDWKSIGQLYAGYLERPENNLQQMAYVVAGGMEFEAEEVQIILACFDAKGGITPIEGEVLEGAAWWPLIERVKAVPHVDLEGPQPPAIKGEHCDTCYQRIHCSAYLLPAMEKVPVELVPFAEPGTGLTASEVLAALDWLDRADTAIKRAEKIRDLAEGQVKTFVSLNGPIRRGDKEYGPAPTNGTRRGPKLEELEALGLGHLIKPGTPGVKFDWRKIGKVA
jgi:hypothetical protein